MDTKKLLSTISNKLGVECKYDKKSNQLNIRIQQNNLTFKPEIIGNIDKSNIGVVIHYLQHLNKKSILITNHVNKVLAEKLQKANIEYIDFSGNMFINTAPVFIYIKGETPQKSSIPDTQHFSLSVASIKIIFTLLTIKSALDRTYREIAKMSDVALGSVGKTLLILEKYGYIVTKNPGEKHLINKEDLFNKWCIGYIERLRPKLIMEKFSTDNLALVKEVNPTDFNFLWGGEIAAAKLTNYLKPQIITLYANDKLPLLQYKCRLKRDVNGSVELLKKFWNFDTKSYEQNTVPFILVYADLLSSTDERNQETAEIIYDKFIEKQME
ncbi:type IV toxin-antitoxin system AbiEi family antitoxin [Legionella gresilensis]|uniref:type IV toxin-antitoxin system AbiEi family antitoxin n=1 Tax=Legionella gresilensis TaxID=91823 RepID=UPI001040E972|nr:type IV toxin-antitoxin system AbiEi family antitoxin [Legionella gresilensis]